MEIITGKLQTAERALVYGTEGIGKSTLALKFPNPLFIDPEDGTKQLDVRRFERPTSWSMLKEQVKYVYAHPDICRTLIIDTVDWAEKLCMEDILAKNDWDSIESPGYGRGYTYLAEEFGRFLNFLTDMVRTKGIHVVLIAHAAIKQTELPEETGKYEFWTLKLEKKTSPLLKEWADLILFCNYKTKLVQDSKTKTNKAVGGQRVMYTSHRTTWDAKNRHDLPEELDMDYARIAHIFDPVPPQYNAAADTPPAAAPQPAAVKQTEPTSPTKKEASASPKVDEDGVVMEEPEAAPEEATPPPPEDLKIIPVKMRPPWKSPPVPSGKEYLKPLYDLMEQSNVTDIELRRAVAEKKWNTPKALIENYNPELVTGGLVGHWDKVCELVTKLREDELPF
ncbi:MAG: ATP-binding protein [Clostridiales Family XIII bacterium]|jgi:hypothetical protein|nr:ATP-binding protein [Clostridiales Family XIII bacterium]